MDNFEHYEGKPGTRIKDVTIGFGKVNVFDFVKEAVKTESKDFKTIAERIVADDPSQVRLLHAAMGMETEAGEFMDALKKHFFYGKPLDYVNLQEELGDQLWYIAIACDVLGVTPEQLMMKVISKLRTRYPDKFKESDAINRDLNAERKVLESE